MPRIAGQAGATAITLSLGPERLCPLPGAPGFHMRLDDDLRKTVVFFGVEDDTPGKGGINCVGTGFLLSYDTCGYLVTAKHLAHGLGDNPFLIRMNKKDGSSANLPADNVRWYEHPDLNVDVAAIPFTMPNYTLLDVLYLPAEAVLADDNAINSNMVGVGDLTYTVGLFRLLSGQRRNLPIVHSGIVAMMPGDERIPVRDWRPPYGKIFVEGYLVETGALAGLSGSPVFMHPTTNFSTLPANFLPDPRFSDPGRARALAPSVQIGLLGLWQSSWDAPPDEVLAVQAGGGVRVPVGMGIVVPAQKIIETLEQEELKAMRGRIKIMREKIAAETAASPDSAMPLATTIDATLESEPSTMEGDEQHKERFTATLTSAAQKRPRGG